tara:strand:+ start:276 stop:2342 length:2067 start_codon:yes stop_codon:yes gene_type:complete
MPSLFLELYSEEIPASLQKKAREDLLKIFNENLQKKEISYKSSISYSTPNRLVFFIDGIPLKIIKKAYKIRGPKINSPKEALEGFVKSKNLNIKDLIEENTEKGKFYFAKIKSQKISVEKELTEMIPEILKKYSWKKSMRWSDYEIKWGRPLKSIVAIFNKRKLSFKFYHILSNNIIFLDSQLQENKKKIKDFSSYLKILKSKKIILDHNLRKEFIKKKIIKISKQKNIKVEINQKLLDEVNDIVESPKIIFCKFNQNYLKIPKEIIIISMQQHQKYFPTFDLQGNLLNTFFVVTNSEDPKGLVKMGNERVIDARLSDAKFFWEKNKSINLVKQVGNLKSMNFFLNLGSLFQKVQRIRALGSLISDQLNFNKEKIEISASICKVDLLSDLVNEYPELQGIMGSYFAKEQGFEDEISLAIKEHYLPIGLDSKIPKKPTSSTVAIADKLDTLVGFFGINEKPTSSKDPYALRRAAFGLSRIIIENNLKFDLRDIIKHSITLYQNQGFNLKNQSVSFDIIVFIRERVKNYLKEKKIRFDVIEAAASSHNTSNFVDLFKKCQILNKSLNKDSGRNILTCYKRVSNILYQETKKNKIKLADFPDSVLFKQEEEKILFDEINEIRKYFSSPLNVENYEKTIEILSKAKLNTDNFFDNVVVNDENESIKKNRLELLKMFCMTFDSFVDFSKIEGV